jgi:hypothetical protein
LRPPSDYRGIPRARGVYAGYRRIFRARQGYQLLVNRLRHGRRYAPLLLVQLWTGHRSSALITDSHVRYVNFTRQGHRPPPSDGRINGRFSIVTVYQWFRITATLPAIRWSRPSRQPVTANHGWLRLAVMSPESDHMLRVGRCAERVPLCGSTRGDGCGRPSNDRRMGPGDPAREGEPPTAAIRVAKRKFVQIPARGAFHCW